MPNQSDVFLVEPDTLDIKTLIQFSTNHVLFKDFKAQGAPRNEKTNAVLFELADVVLSVVTLFVDII